MDDLINRQAAVDAMSRTWTHIHFVARRRKPTKSEEAVYLDMVGSIKRLPSAEPERKTGEWMAVSNHDAYGGENHPETLYGNGTAFHYCSNCSNHAYVNEEGEEILSRFCPDCGTDMRATR